MESYLKSFRGLDLELVFKLSLSSKMEKLIESMLKVLTLGRKSRFFFSFKLANSFSFKLNMMYSVVAVLQNTVDHFFFHKTLVDSSQAFSLSLILCMAMWFF